MKNSEGRIRLLVEKYKSMSNYEKREWEEGRRYVAGIDEAGRGPLAGPVVAAACILDCDCPILGLDDSKKLSEKRRDELFSEITRKAVSYSVARIENNIIDEINILAATKRAMLESICMLNFPPDKVLIDAVRLDDLHINQEEIIRGDSLSVSIAAASILAKVTRDEIMRNYDRTYPGYGFAQNKGYGTKAHYEGIRIHGITPIHRKSFLKGIV
jgi:ribonuclease HII